MHRFLHEPRYRSRIIPELLEALSRFLIAHANAGREWHRLGVDPGQSAGHWLRALATLVTNDPKPPAFVYPMTAEMHQEHQRMRLCLAILQLPPEAFDEALAHTMARYLVHGLLEILPGADYDERRERAVADQLTPLFLKANGIMAAINPPGMHVCRFETEYMGNVPREYAILKRGDRVICLTSPSTPWKAGTYGLRYLMETGCERSSEDGRFRIAFRALDLEPFEAVIMTGLPGTQDWREARRISSVLTAKV